MPVSILKKLKKPEESLCKVVVLLVGASGSGKSTLAQYLHDHYGMKVLDSYTTRPQRSPEETGHRFISKEEADDIMVHEKIVADTKYNGHVYFATQDQVDESDVYVIDPDGLDKLLRNYTGKKQLVSFFIQLDEHTRCERMKQRGDSDEMIDQRLEYDKRHFIGIPLRNIDFFLNGKKSTKHMAKMVLRVTHIFQILLSEEIN